MANSDAPCRPRSANPKASRPHRRRSRARCRAPCQPPRSQLTVNACPALNHGRLVLHVGLQPLHRRPLGAVVEHDVGALRRAPVAGAEAPQRDALDGRMFPEHRENALVVGELDFIGRAVDVELRHVDRQARSPRADRGWRCAWTSECRRRRERMALHADARRSGFPPAAAQ